MILYDGSDVIPLHSTEDSGQEKRMLMCNNKLVLESTCQFHYCKGEKSNTKNAKNKKSSKLFNPRLVIGSKH
jgi:hypothetical protein